MSTDVGGASHLYAQESVFCGVFTLVGARSLLHDVSALLL